MFTKSPRFYDALDSFKDYAHAAQRVHKTIQEVRPAPARALGFEKEPTALRLAACCGMVLPAMVGLVVTGRYEKGRREGGQVHLKGLELRLIAVRRVSVISRRHRARDPRAPAEARCASDGCRARPPESGPIDYDRHGPPPLHNVLIQGSVLTTAVDTENLFR